MIYYLMLLAEEGRAAAWMIMPTGNGIVKAASVVQNDERLANAWKS